MNRTLLAAFVAFVTFVAGAVTLATSALAAYPEKPVRVVVPYAAGGPTDIAARMVATELARRLGQPFVVENRAGAGGNVGAEMVAHAPGDGYTLLVYGAAHAINKSLYAKLAYDPQRDFAPVATFSTAPMILLAHPGATLTGVKEVVAAAKAQPGKINYCSAGSGTAPHLAMELFKARAGIDLVHVPYKGSAPGIADLLAGQVQLCFDSLVVWQQHAASGKIRALAVTGPKRSDIAPDVPTMAESGFPKFDAGVWYGLVAPAATPSEVVQTLNRTINEILGEPEIKNRLRTLGAEPLVKSPAEFKQFIDAEVATWAEVVRFSKARVD